MKLLCISLQDMLIGNISVAYTVVCVLYYAVEKHMFQCLFAVLGRHRRRSARASYSSSQRSHVKRLECSRHMGIKHRLRSSSEAPPQDAQPRRCRWIPTHDARIASAPLRLSVGAVYSATFFFCAFTMKSNSSLSMAKLALQALAPAISSMGQTPKKSRVQCLGDRIFAEPMRIEAARKRKAASS